MTIVNEYGGGFLAIETISSHVMVAKSFKNDLPNLWLSIGKTTPWVDEDIPPAEDMFTTTLDEVIGFKKFDTAQLVVPVSSLNNIVPDKTVSYKAEDWAFVTDDDAMKLGARYVYLEATIGPGELPYAVYRQIGIYKGLAPQDRFLDKTALTPNQIEDAGVLLGYDNRLFQRYSDNVKLIEKIVLKF